MRNYQIDGLLTTDITHPGAMAHDAWREWCSMVHGESRFNFGRESYRGHVRRQRTSTYQLLSWTSEAEHAQRDARGIRRDPRGHYELVVPISDRLYVGIDGPDRRLDAGEMALLPVDTPFHVAHDDGAKGIILLIPFHRIDDRLRARSPRGQRVLAGSGLARVARDLLLSLIRERDSVTGHEFDAIADRAVDLFCLAAVGDQRAPAVRGGSVVLDAVHRYVREHVTDTELSVAAMAAAIGWSARYIQSILAREGTTASELIRNERLDLARTRLTSAAFDSYSIADVAASVGFGSPSAFSAAFRLRFGSSPREIRWSASEFDLHPAGDVSGLRSG